MNEDTGNRARPFDKPTYSLVSFAVGFAMVTTFLITTAAPALAVTCTKQGHGVVAFVPFPQTGFGNRASSPGIAVRNTTLNCPRASTLQVVDTDNFSTFVEVGWFDTCGDSGQCPQPCDYILAPHVLVYREINGDPSCKSGTPATSETSPPNDGYAFKVSNPDHDNSFDYYYETAYQGFYFVGFSHGYLFSMVGERHNGGDPAWGHDQAVISYLGASGNWNNWTGTQGSSDVNDYSYCHYGDMDIASKQTC